MDGGPSERAPTMKEIASLLPTKVAHDAHINRFVRLKPFDTVDGRPRYFRAALPADNKL